MNLFRHQTHLCPSMTMGGGLSLKICSITSATSLYQQTENTYLIFDNVRLKILSTWLKWYAIGNTMLSISMSHGAIRQRKALNEKPLMFSLNIKKRSVWGQIQTRKWNENPGRLLEKWKPNNHS